MVGWFPCALMCSVKASWVLILTNQPLEIRGQYPMCTILVHTTARSYMDNCQRIAGLTFKDTLSNNNY